MPFPDAYGIVKSNDSQLRAQITNALNELRQEIEDLQNLVDILVDGGYLLLESGTTDRITLEDGSGFLLLESGTDLVNEEVFTFDEAVLADGDYTLWYDAPFGGTITKVRTECTSGTATLTGKVNSTALGGTANSVSSTAQEQSHSSSNTFAKGDVVKFTISSNSACLVLAGAFYMTRTS